MAGFELRGEHGPELTLPKGDLVRIGTDVVPSVPDPKEQAADDR